MGILIKLEDTDRKGKIRKIGQEPVWMGYRDDTKIKRFMPPSKAQDWVHMNPDNKIKLSCKKFELDKL